MKSEVESARLLDLLQRPATYGIVKAGEFQTSGVPMLRGGDIKGGRIGRGLPFVTKKKSEEFSRTVLRRGDVVVALVGYPGDSAVVPDWLVGANISRAVGLLRPGSKLLPEYLAQYLNSSIGRAEFLKPSAGSAQIVVNLVDLNKLQIPLYSLPEQRAIVEVLTDADEAVSAIERAIMKVRAIKQGMLQQLLTGRTRLPGFTAPWRKSQLGDVLTVRHGKSQRNVEVPSGRYPILATGGQIGWTNTPLYSKPSVLIGRKGTIDRPQFQDRPFWTVDTLFYTEISLAADPRFLYYKFLTVDWRSMNEASGVPSLSSTRIEGVELQLPEVDEQVAIREALDDVDQEIAVMQQRLSKARDFKIGLVQQLLTGRTHLPVETAS